MLQTSLKTDDVRVLLIVDDGSQQQTTVLLNGVLQLVTMSPEALHYHEQIDAVLLAVTPLKEDLLRSVREIYADEVLIVLTGDDSFSTAWVEAYRILEIVPLERIHEVWLGDYLRQLIQGAERDIENRLMRDIARILNQSADPDQAIDALFRRLQDAIPYDTVDITLLEDENLRVTYGQGYPADVMRELRHTSLPVSDSYQRHVIDADEPILVGDVRQDAALAETWLLDWARSWIGMPLKRGDRVLGVINFNSGQPNRFNRRHLVRLQAIAAHLSALVEMIQLHNRLEHNNNLLAAISRQNAFLQTSLNGYDRLDDLCHFIAHTVVQLFGKTDCGVMLLDKDEAELVRYTRVGDYDVTASAPLHLDGDGLAVEAVTTGSTVYAPDVSQVPNYLPNEPRTRSELVIPLKTRSGVIGVLDLQSTQEDAFGRLDRDGLVAFAEHAAMAIHNLQLYSRVREHTLELEERVKQHTVALQHSKERVEAILNRTGDALALLHTDGSIAQVNSAFERLFSVQPDELYAVSIETMAVAEHRGRMQRLIESVQSSGEQQTADVTMQNAAKRMFAAEITLSVVRFHGHERSDMVCSIRDVSKHKTIETTLRSKLESERELNELKTRFILTVTHEFRTPLAVILSSSELLRDFGHGMDEERREKHFERILQQVKHMEGILADALVVEQAQQRQTDFHPMPVDGLQLLKDAVRVLNAMDGHPPIVLSLHPDDEADFSIKADQVLLRQIFDNLLSNAVKYAPTSDRVLVSLMSRAEAIVLRVEDDGIGIPQDDQPHLFKPFFRAANVSTIQGSGLGLSIVKTAVELHNGQLEIQSQEGSGTVITVTLPR